MGIHDPTRFDKIPDALTSEPKPAESGGGYRPARPVAPAVTPAPVIVPAPATLPIISGGPVAPKDIPPTVLETAPPQVQREAGYQPRRPVGSPAVQNNHMIPVLLVLIAIALVVAWKLYTTT